MTSMRYLGVLSSIPDLDFGVWMVTDSITGNLVVYDYFGGVLGVDDENKFYKTNRRFGDGSNTNQGVVTLPNNYILSQNYPNPFNPTTKIEFTMMEAGQVTLEVHNILGERVTTLVNKYLPAGNHTAVWSATDNTGQTVASGIYFYRFAVDGFSETKKMTLMK